MSIERSLKFAEEMILRPVLSEDLLDPEPLLKM